MPDISPRIRIAGLLEANLALLGVATVAAFADAYGWGFELLAHFRVQYSCNSVLLALPLLVLRKPRAACLCGLLAIVNCLPVLSLYRPAQPVAESGPRFRVALMNVQTAHDDYDRARAFVRQRAPDILVVLEVDRRWLEELGSLRDDYPHVVARPRSDNFGIALFSRVPFLEARSLSIGAPHNPSILASVNVQGQKLTVLGTHAVPPLGRSEAAQRNAHLAAIPATLASVEGRRILLGDLNCTPWSTHFRRLVRGTEMRNSAVGWGLQPTWPAGLPPFWIPIDHCLYSEGIQVVQHQVGKAFGSDHYPLVVDFVLPPGPG